MYQELYPQPPKQTQEGWKIERWWCWRRWRRRRWPEWRRIRKWRSPLQQSLNHQSGPGNVSRYGETKLMLRIARSKLWTLFSLYRHKCDERILFIKNICVWRAVGVIVTSCASKPRDISRCCSESRANYLEEAIYKLRKWWWGRRETGPNGVVTG